MTSPKSWRNSVQTSLFFIREELEAINTCLLKSPAAPMVPTRSLITFVLSLKDFPEMCARFGMDAAPGFLTSAMKVAHTHGASDQKSGHRQFKDSLKLALVL